MEVFLEDCLSLFIKKKKMVITKGAKVRVLRKESFWYNQTGLVVTVDQSAVRYPVLVRFEKVNYAGTNNSNFALDELKAVEKKA